MMDVTERMLTEILPIGTKAIMDTDPLELRQDADGVQGLFAALGMDGIVRQLLGGADMHPVALAFHMQARFILMQHLRTREGGFDLLLHRLEVLGTPLHQPLKGTHAHARSQQILHHFASSFIGQQLLLDQIDSDCSKGGSILHWRSHIKRESSGTDLVTGRAVLLLCLMFDHHDTLGRQIKHLAAFHLQALHRTQILLTVVALLDRVHNHRIGSRRQLQGASQMTNLSPSLLAAFLAQALGLPMKAIGGGRQVTDVTVLVEPILQGLHLLTEQHDLLLHLDDLCILLGQLLLQQALFLSQFKHFFFGCHRATLSILSCFDKPSRTPEWLHEIYDLLELLEWQRVWDWASKTRLAPFLLSQTPLREQIEQEGITEALGATTWHSQF